MGKLIKRFFRKRSRFLIGFFLLAVIFVAIWGADVAPYDPLDVQLKQKLSPPSARHLLGTDNLGRDVLSRVMAATGVSLGAGLIILLASTVVGTVFGMISGYSGGRVDEIMMRITDIFLAFPALVLAMAITAVLGPSLRNAMLAISVTWWPWYARLVRGMVLGIKEEEYILAARCIGAPTWRIGLFHIIPNVIVPVIVQAAMDMGSALVTASSLSFMGLGVQPPQPEWGAMINEGRDYVFAAWWMGVFPGLAIFGAVYLFNALGDAINSTLTRRDVG
jgi:peptide/nickel transport system permease protein